MGKQDINSFYISSGAKNAQYTLRACYEDFDCNGKLKVFDRYVRNLGTNIERAKSTAEKYAGMPVKFEHFELNPYGKCIESNISADMEIDAEILQQNAIAASAAAEIIRKREAENALSQWQGEIGERITKNLTCLRWVPLGYGAYGQRWLGIFNDEKMNKYVFFGGMAASLPGEGKSAIVNFIVKSHGEHQGCKQTIINRPKKGKF